MGRGYLIPEFRKRESTNSTPFDLCLTCPLREGVHRASAHPRSLNMSGGFEAHNTNEAMLNVQASGMARTETKREKI